MAIVSSAETPAEPDPYGPFEANPNIPTRDFRYVQDLHLVRLQTAPVLGARTRKIRFIVDGDYRTIWSDIDMTGRDNDDPAWHEVVVPRGYCTDFATVPRPLRWVVGQIGPWAEASVVHDYLCDAWKWQGKDWDPARRFWADRLMKVTMDRTGIGFTRIAIYGAITAYRLWLSLRYWAGTPPEISRDRGDYIIDLDKDGAA